MLIAKAFAVRTNEKWPFSFFKRNRFDIIFLQETHWTVDLDMQINASGRVSFFCPWDELFSRCGHIDCSAPGLQ